jgi:ABC-type lipoprotein release transport system permease subunit
MRGLLRIAFRSVFADRRRSILIGLSLFISCVVLLLAYAIGNGAGGQLLGRYHATQSADVVVVWKNVLEDVDPSDPGRLQFSEPDGKTRDANAAAISRLDAFLTENASAVTAVYRPVRGFGMLDTGSYATFATINGIGGDELAFLENERVLQLIEGDPLTGFEYGIYISEDTAVKTGIWYGDYVSLDATTASGLVNTMDFQVAGVYRNGAPWYNITVYIRQDDARDLMEWDASWFGSARIYLNDPSSRASFAARLDAALIEAGGALRAEPSDVSTRFWESFAGLLKGVFTFFIVFLLLVIAIGIRSTIRMNLFLRIQEFGTLRAIGFTRPQGFLIVFLEAFLISVLALAAAAIAAGGLVSALAWTGIYVGPGAASYALGAEYVYPVLGITDLVFALAIVTGFSLLAPLGPGLKLCGQKITDMLARRQRRVSTIACLFKGGVQ